MSNNELKVYFFNCMNAYTSGLQVAIAYNQKDAIDHIVKIYDQDLLNPDKPEFQAGLWWKYAKKTLRQELEEDGPFKVLRVADGVAGYCGGGD